MNKHVKKALRKEVQKAVGRRLIMTREVIGLLSGEPGVSQGEFARRAGISHTTYNQYETGKHPVSVESALALCKTYGLTLDWIYQGDPSGLRYKLADALKALGVRHT